MHPDLRLAVELADLADTLTLERFRATDLVVDTKADSTPVTEVDRRVESALRERLGQLRPEHAVVGEEFGGDARSGACWYIDPVDGTKNYARGVPIWATLLALHIDGAGVCAVVSAPSLQRRWLAARGEGAWDGNGVRLHVSAIGDLAEASLSCTDFRDFSASPRAAGFDALAGGCKVVRGFGDFWSHMLVAEGAVDLAVELGVKPWDIAPVQLIVREAGGACTDITGSDRMDTASVLSSNGSLHETAMRTLQAS